MAILLECKDYLPNQRIFDLNLTHFCRDYFYPLQRACGSPKITLHDLRHTFASLLAMAGVSVYVIQKLLGHADLKTTLRYMHLAPDHLLGATDVLCKHALEKKLPFKRSYFDLSNLQEVATAGDTFKETA